MQFIKNRESLNQELLATTLAHAGGRLQGGWSTPGAYNDTTDVAEFSGAEIPCAVGSYTWSIPVRWRVKGMNTEHTLPDRIQVNELLAPNGESKVAKFDESTTRTP